MDAKVTVSKDTLLEYKNFSAKKRAQLRRQAVKDLIASKPYGTYISLVQFSRVCQFNQDNGAYYILRSMCKAGELVRHDEVGKPTFYTVEHPIRITYGARKQKTPAKVPIPNKVFNIDQLDESAMRYQWHYGNDLKGFITWLRSQ